MLKWLLPGRQNGNMKFSIVPVGDILARPYYYAYADRQNSGGRFLRKSARSLTFTLCVFGIALHVVLIRRITMKKSIIVAAAILGLVSLNAHAEDYLHGQSGTTYQNIGNSTYGSNGSTSQKIGNTTYGSYGSTSQRIGNTNYLSDGSTSQQIGNTLYNSNGTTVQRIGNTTYGSDGTTCQKIGNSTYCN